MGWWERMFNVNSRSCFLFISHFQFLFGWWKSEIPELQCFPFFGFYRRVRKNLTPECRKLLAILD